MTNIYSIIEERANREGLDKIFIQTFDQEISFEEFREMVSEKANELVKESKNFILYVANNTIDTLVIDFAIAKVNKVSVPIYQTHSENQIKEIREAIDELEVQYKENYEEIASVLFTPGTEGKHDPVIISNSNILDNLASFSRVVLKSGDSFSNYLSVLPLAHAMPRIMLYFAFLNSDTISLCPEIRQVNSCFVRFMPTFTLLVPKILEHIYADICIESSQNFLTKLFKFKKDKQIEKQIYQIFGDTKVSFYVGGQRLSDNVIEFFSKRNFLYHDIYTLTQIGGAVSVDSQVLDYLDIEISPNKEIVIKQNGQIIKTGDEGEYSENTLKIIGRKKDFIVTSGGKNIAPTPLQNEISSDPLISDALIIGERRPYITAMISIDEEEATKLYFEKGLDSNSIEAKAYIDQYVEKIIHKINKKLSSSEQIKKFIIIEDGFGEDDGTVSETMSLKRDRICKLYKKEINKLLYG